MDESLSRRSPRSSNGSVSNDEARRLRLTAELASLGRIRPFPVDIAEIIDHISQGDFDERKLCEVLIADPSLAAHMRRAVNSILSFTEERHPSLEAAISRLGVSRMVELAAGIGAMSFFGGLEGVASCVRNHCLGTAVIGRFLAIHTGQHELASRVFVVGLLHDIGKLVLIRSGTACPLSPGPRSEEPDLTCARAQEGLGSDHAVLGGQLLERWALPAPTPELVAWHHAPDRVYRRSGFLSRILALLRVADALEPLLAQGTLPHHETLDALRLGEDGLLAGVSGLRFLAIWHALRQAHLQGFSAFERNNPDWGGWHYSSKSSNAASSASPPTCKVGP